MNKLREMEKNQGISEARWREQLEECGRHAQDEATFVY